MGLAQFGDTVKVEFQLNQYSAKSDVGEHVKRLRLAGSRTRNTGEAITYARRNLFSSENGARGYKQYLVLITSGKSNDNVIKASRVIRDQGVTVLTVGLGQADKDELSTITTTPYIYLREPVQQIIQDIKTAIDSVEILKVPSGRYYYNLFTMGCISEICRQVSPYIMSKMQIPNHKCILHCHTLASLSGSLL